MFDGEAITLWRLRLRERTLCCFVAEWSTGFWLGIECSAGELQLSETLQDLGDLLNRAEQLKRTYLDDGWTEDAFPHASSRLPDPPHRP